MNDDNINDIGNIKQHLIGRLLPLNQTRSVYVTYYIHYIQANNLPFYIWVIRYGKVHTVINLFTVYYRYS